MVSIKQSKHFGVSLLELIISLVIVSLLAAISLPLYHHYQMRGYRSQAMMMLMQLAAQMEIYHLEHNSYQGASLLHWHMKSFIAHKQYKLAIASATKTRYLLLATPRLTQVTDRCGELSLDARGKRSANQQDCW